MRFMILVKASAGSEAGVMPPDSRIAEMAAYHEALAQAGVLLDAAGLQASSKGWRVRYHRKRRSVFDGPFTESKEVIGGFAILEAPSLEEAVALTRRFLKVHGDEWDVECEVRQMEGPDFDCKG